jgi:hypothetical protein
MARNGIYLVNGKLTFVMADLRQIAIAEGCLEVSERVDREAILRNPLELLAH